MDEKEKERIEKALTAHAGAANSFFAGDTDAHVYVLDENIQIIKMDDESYYVTYQKLGEGAQGAVYKGTRINDFNQLPLTLSETDVALKFNDYSENGFASTADIKADIAK